MNAKKELLAKQYYRWMKLGPWYAMFPMQFALETIEKHTKKGQAVLDPFMGRGTTLAAATMLGRNSAGIEINPIAWLYAQTKMNIAPKQDVLNRLKELNVLSELESIPKLPEFFEWCFCTSVLKFLLTARRILDWQNNSVDRTLMAIILVDLHGKESTSLSNQMRQTKAMAPLYSVNWWKQKDMPAREKNPMVVLESKIEWRYAHEHPVHSTQSLAILGDSTSDMNAVAPLAPYHLLLTSPPYYKIINYNYDQWIRRWMLGGPEFPVFSAGKHQSTFGDQKQYQELLNKVFSNAALMLHDRAKLVIRTDAREFTFETTLAALELAFPNKSIEQIQRPFLNKTQTQLFGNPVKQAGEIDLILLPRQRKQASPTNSVTKGLLAT
jgi:hypothetical protein